KVAEFAMRAEEEARERDLTEAARDQPATAVAGRMVQMVVQLSGMLLFYHGCPAPVAELLRDFQTAFGELADQLQAGKQRPQQVPVPATPTPAARLPMLEQGTQREDVAMGADEEAASALVPTEEELGKLFPRVGAAQVKRVMVCNILEGVLKCRKLGQ
ncbi:MAG: hypothetical protein ACKPKO_04990, partial [Candidatus Fonsibacter sp.]